MGYKLSEMQLHVPCAPHEFRGAPKYMYMYNGLLSVFRGEKQIALVIGCNNGLHLSDVEYSILVAPLAGVYG